MAPFRTVEGPVSEYGPRESLPWALWLKRRFGLLWSGICLRGSDGLQGAKRDPSYSHIHYDSDQARTISVREAARLQSFPDGFQFCGTMNPAFRQIGNAVPPLMALALAREIRRVLPRSSGLAEEDRDLAAIGWDCA